MDQDTKIKNCPDCNSNRVISGKIDDGNNRKLYSAYFDPGNTKYSIWKVNRAINIGKELECCTNCGLIWRKTEPTWILEFIIRECKEEFVKSLFNPVPTVKEYGIVDHGSINIRPDFKADTICINCGSSKLINGRFYIYLRFRREYFSLKRYSIFFNPGQIKLVYFLFKRGVQINEKVRCCLECGYLFSRIDKTFLKDYIRDKCKIAFYKAVYEEG